MGERLLAPAPPSALRVLALRLSCTGLESTEEGRLTAHREDGQASECGGAARGGKISAVEETRGLECTEMPILFIVAVQTIEK